MFLHETHQREEIERGEKAKVGLLGSPKFMGSVVKEIS
jgi:hypothetical protein